MSNAPLSHQVTARWSAMWNHDVSINFFHRLSDGAVAHFQPPTVRRYSREELEDFNSVSTPRTLTMSEHTARALMDELWALGLRPTDGTASVGEIAAVRAHLSDLQRLVFKDGKP